MSNEQNIIKSKRLKFIRMLMYLDALMLMLSFMMIDFRYFSFAACSGICLRIVVLIVIFIFLFILEKGVSRYLRKHRES